MALGRVSDLSESTCDFTMGHSGGDNTKTKVLREAAEIVNDLIHEEICSENWQSNPKFFNITNEIRKINPSLWHFIECATRSTRERMSTRTREENTFIQKCRRLFFLFLFLHSVQIPSLVPRPFYARGAHWERDKGLVPVVRACVKFYWNPGKIVFFGIG